MSSVQSKKCPSCRETKPLTFEFFYRSRQTLSGFRPLCKPCVNVANREYNRAHPEKTVARVLKSRNRSESSKADHRERSRRWAKENPMRRRDGYVSSTFGVPRGWFEEQLVRTGGRCEICGVQHLSVDYKKFISVDHCHETGSVRGLLCERCNFGLGNFNDNVLLLEKAAEYLKRRTVNPLFEAVA